jgi:hypothetical protein
MISLHIRSQDFPTQNPSSLNVNINPPVTLNGNYEIALTNLLFSNTVVNISAALGNNVIRYSPNSGTTWYTITFIDESCDATSLENQIAVVLINNGNTTTVNGEIVYPINFVADVNQDRITIGLSAGYYLDLTNVGFAKLIGFTPQTLQAVTTTVFTATNAAQFTYASDYYYIFTNLISNGVISTSGQSQGLIKTVQGGAMGYNITLSNLYSSYQYFPLTVNQLNQFNITIYDTNGNIANLRGERTFFDFEIRKVKE